MKQRGDGPRASEDKHQGTILDANHLAQRAEAAKTARLKELRLAKEAADRLSGEGIHIARRKRRPALAK